MNTDNILIDNDDIEFAQDLCKSMQDISTRNRSVANSLSARVVKKIFDDDMYNVDTSSGICNIPFVLEDIEISDIYINGSYVDVRFYLDENQIFIPKYNYDNGILPAAYMFLKLSQDLSSCTLSGFVLPQNVETNNIAGDYYKISESSFVSIYDVESRFVTVADEADLSEKEIYNYADGLCEDKVAFYKKLIKSVSSRYMLAKIAKAKSVFNFVSLDVTSIQNEPEVDEFSELITSTDDMYSNAEQINSQENDDSEFSTMTTPSITEEDLSVDAQEPVAESVQNEEQISALFENNEGENANADAAQDNIAEENPVQQVNVKKKKSPVVFVAVAVLLAASGFYLYNNFVQSNSDIEEVEQPVTEAVEQPEKVENAVKEKADAMPDESVEKMPQTKSKEEAAPVEIPAIEKNLDASVLVSNLKVKWEVPSGYASSTAANRYLVTLGKTIQLQLKAELLLLSRPPITNKIAVEIKYNPYARQYEAVGVVTSSGEKVVDDIIMQTVKKALKMNINVNTDALSKLQGNPVLVINL